MKSGGAALSRLRRTLGWNKGDRVLLFRDGGKEEFLSPASATLGILDGTGGTAETADWVLAALSPSAEASPLATIHRALKPGGTVALSLTGDGQQEFWRGPLIVQGFGDLKVRKRRGQSWLTARKIGPDGFIPPRVRLPLLLRGALGLAEKRLGKTLGAQRLLAWYPKAFWGSGILELLVAHDEPEVPRRLLALIRILVSFRASCAFCIDLNARDFEDLGVHEGELKALQVSGAWTQVPSFSESERAALDYAEAQCRTPVALTPEVVLNLRRHFTERGVTILATTTAQVNFWARLIQGLGVLPAGFSGTCPVLSLDFYQAQARGKSKSG